MAFGTFIFGDYVFMLCGTGGMIEAAKQYCEQRDQLELTEYVAWIIQHKLSACVCMKADTNGLLDRIRTRQWAQRLNDILDKGGSYIRAGLFFGRMKLEDPEMFEETYPLCYIEKREQGIPDEAKSI